MQWFGLYPEFLNNPFFISGESYAGVYVPMLASEVVKGTFFIFKSTQVPDLFNTITASYPNPSAGIDSGVKPILNFKVCSFFFCKLHIIDV